MGRADGGGQWGLSADWLRWYRKRTSQLVSPCGQRSEPGRCHCRAYNRGLRRSAVPGRTRYFHFGPPSCNGGIVLTHLLFTLDGQRYFAKVDRSVELGMWCVSVDGGPRHPAFPPRSDDDDTAEFRRRLAQAAHRDAPHPSSPPSVRRLRGRPPRPSKG